MTEIYIGPIEEVKLVEKVKLTKEQAVAIEQVKDKDYAINILALQKRPDHPLATLEISLIAKLLYGLVEYEIEPGQPEYKPGDKVFLYVNGSAYIETLTMKNPHVKGDWGTEQGCGCISEKEFRHATSEEIYWLETLDRERVGEVKNGDAVLFEDESISFIDFSTHRGFLREMMKERGFKGIYPAESFKSFRGDSK